MPAPLRNIPPFLDKALRRAARLTGASLNDVALDALAKETGIDAQPVPHRKLRDLAGTWVEDPAFDAAIGDQQRIDVALWR